MKINFEIFKTIFYIGISIQIAFASPITENTIDDIHKQDVLDYVKELKANADLSEDPCNNFRKYACGSMQLNKSLNVWDWRSLANKYFIDTDPATETDKMIREYLIKRSHQKVDKENQDFIPKIKQIWKELDYLKSVKTFPVNKDSVDSKTIGELAAHLTYFPTKALFSPNFSKKVQLEIHAHYANITDLNEDLFIQIAKVFNREPNEIADAIRKVKNFIDEINQIESSQTDASKPDDDIHITSFKDLKQIFPSEHLDWNGYHDVLINYFNLTHPYDIIVKNSNLFKAVIKLIDETDIETILNYELYSVVHLYLIEFENDADFIFETFGKHAVLYKIWEENLSTNRTIDRFSKFLDKFEASLNKMNEKYQNNNFDYIQDFINNKRLVLKNHNIYVNESTLNEYYEKFEPNQYYKTIQIILWDSIRRLSKYNFYNDTENLKLWGGSFNMAIPLNSKNKPYLFYYAKESADIYRQYYRFYRSYDDINPIKECLAQLNENVNTYSFLFDYAVIKSILMTDNLNELLQNEYELLAEIKEEPMKLFFIALTQDECRMIGNQESKSTLEKTFPYIPEFVEAFKCPKGTKMTDDTKKICKLPGCDTTKFKQELLPFTIEC